MYQDDTGEWFWKPEDTELVVAWLEHQGRQELAREGGSPFFGGTIESRLASAEADRLRRLDRDYPVEACVPTQDTVEVLATPYDLDAYRCLIRDRSRLR